MPFPLISVIAFPSVKSKSPFAQNQNPRLPDLPLPCLTGWSDTGTVCGWYSKELGLTVLPEARTVVADSFSFTDALALYHRLKGTGKTSLFFESSERSIRYLIECLGHESLTSLEVSDAGRFRDYLFEHACPHHL